MHHVGVFLYREQFVDVDRAVARHATDVVAAKVYEHEMLGTLLWIIAQLRSHSFIVAGVNWSGPRSSDGSHGYAAVRNSHEKLWGAADKLHVAERQMVHVRRRVNRAQRAVQCTGIEIGGELDASRDNDLEAVSSTDVLLRCLDVADEFLSCPARLSASGFGFG